MKLLQKISSILELQNKNNDFRFEWDELFLIITKLISYRSSCAKTRQAVLLVKENRIISFGYNGPAAGKLNCLFDGGEEACGKDSSGSCLNGIHAEQNAIAWATKNGINISGSKMYCTQSPCISCARLVVAAGIQEFYYIEEYRKNEGKKFLEDHNVICLRLT